MSCKYNDCKICGYKSECEIFKENAELKGEADSVLDNWCKGDDPCPHLKKRDEQLTKAKELLKGWLSDFYNPKAFYQQRAELVEQSEQFVSEVNNALS